MRIALDNRFTATLTAGLRAAGHDVAVVAPTTEGALPVGRLDEAADTADVVLSCWADATAAYLSKRTSGRLVTFLRSYEALTPGEAMPNLSGLLCSFPDGLGLCIGALQQSISEFRFTAARVECLEARYVGPGAP